MSTSSTTIRVSVETRDLLAKQAERRGLSLSALVNRLAQKEVRDSIFQSERDASRIDEGRPQVVEEMKAWEATTGDGIE
jgi:predicted DsbA family dithiol-disulfide isomerase